MDKNPAYEEAKRFREEHRESVERAIRSPEGAVHVIGEGLADQAKKVHQGIERGDVWAASEPLGNLAVNIPALGESVFENLPGGGSPPQPDLVTPEGYTIPANASVASSATASLPSGAIPMANMANSKSGGGGKTETEQSPPDKKYWNKQEELSAEKRAEETGKPVLREVEIYVEKEVGKLEKAQGIRFDALETGDLRLNEWTTNRMLEEGTNKWAQVNRRLSLFTDAQNFGWTLWARPQGQSTFWDVTQSQHFIGTYAHWGH